MYSFNFKNIDVLGRMRSNSIWQFNLAQNMALLSNDSKVVQRFYREDAPLLLGKSYLTNKISDAFLAQGVKGQAFVYFGLCSMIAEGVQNLVSSGGFKCESESELVEKALNKFIDDCRLQELFSKGVYYESGLGDFAYRLSYDPAVSDKPIIDIIEPQHLELVYKRGRISTIIIKEVAAENKRLELHEAYSKTANGFVQIEYFLKHDGKYVFESEDKELYKQFLGELGVGESDIKKLVLPLREFPVVYKQNHKHNMIYRGQRGVPDIQGIDTIDDALSESASDLIDAIRKGGVTTFLDESMLSQDADGNKIGHNPFNKTIVTTKGSSLDNNNLISTVQGDIRWQAYVETCKYLISHGLNKAGISPTTIGITGLESINSSVESQDAREKPSLRKRKESLKGWRLTLTELMNKYLQMSDYISGNSILDYSEYIHISFNEYVNPEPSEILDIIGTKLELGLMTHTDAIREINPSLNQEQAFNRMLEIMDEQRLLDAHLNIKTLEETENEPETV